MEWISVKDRLPEIDQPIMAYSEKGYIYQCHLIFTKPYLAWMKEGLDIGDPYITFDEPTHWMLLPSPPFEFIGPIRRMERYSKKNAENSKIDQAANDV